MRIYLLSLMILLIINHVLGQTIPTPICASCNQQLLPARPVPSKHWLDSIRNPYKFDLTKNRYSKYFWAHFYISKQGSINHYEIDNLSYYSEVEKRNIHNELDRSPEWTPASICNYPFTKDAYLYLPVPLPLIDTSDYGCILVVESPAEFPGGANSWQKFLDKNLALKKLSTPTSEYQRQKYCKTIIYTMKIDKKGYPYDPVILNEEQLDSEQIEAFKGIFKNAPLWKPAVHMARSVEDLISGSIEFNW